MRKTPLKRSRKPLKRTPLKKQSVKQKTRLDRYMRARREFINILELKDHWLQCEVCKDMGFIPTRTGTEVHHKKGRAGAMLWNQTYFLWVCRWCHDQIHENPKWARAQGYLL
jgi:hypothetical protein